MPGEYRVTVSSPGWMTKSIVTGGRDVADTVLTIGDSGVTDLVVTLTDHASELSGRLLDAAGQPNGGYYVVVFPTDQSLWRQGRVRCRRPCARRATAPINLRALPAGSYYVAALTEFDAADLTDAAFLQALITSAIRVPLAEGEKKTLDLKLAR